MGFERARTDEQILNRKDEIRKACATLYDTSGIEGVTFKAIGNMTSFGRSTIYNYYKTKEEVLLDLLADDLNIWTDSVAQMVTGHPSLTREAYCNKMTQLYINNMRMLKLYGILSPILEQNSSLEKLIDFKKSFVHVTEVMTTSLTHFFPNANQEAIASFYVTSLVYTSSLYPITHLTDKQKKAMSHVPLDYSFIDFEDLCYKGLLALTSML